MSAGGITARATIMVPVFSGQHYLSASADIDGEYRYSLERRWEYGGPTALARPRPLPPAGRPEGARHRA